MPHPGKGVQLNTGRTHFQKGQVPWNKTEPLEKNCLQCSITFFVRPSWDYVKHCSKKCATLTGKLKITGGKSYLWKGGSIYWAKQEVKEHDNYTCQKCGLREPEIMQVDHIIPVAIAPELSAELTNMETLCPNCHARKTVQDRLEIKSSKSLTAD